MNKFIYIFIAAISVFLFSCEEDPKTHAFPSTDVDFTYSISEGDYKLAYIIGSQIDFENSSVLTGAPTWDFGDGTTSIEPNPKHIYNDPGVYDVTLTIDGQKRVKKILISDMETIVTYSSSTGEESYINASVISLDISLPNPGNYDAFFKWTLPEGTMDEAGNLITESNLQNPGKLTFKHVGSQQLQLETSIQTENGLRTLDTKTINVQIGYSDKVKTIYLACKDGVLRAFKLIQNLPAGVNNNVFNLPASSGSHGFNLLFNKKDTLVYVLDAGKQYYFVDDVDGNLGDGRITAVSKDGKTTQVVTSNVGGTAFNDPFYGYFDESTQNIYYSDRNTGIRMVSASVRNSSVIDQSYFVENNKLGYYDAKQILYGAGNANFTKVGDVWWWGKYFNTNGIFRFTDSDIGKTTVPSAGAAMSGGFVVIKSFAVDSKRSMVYYAVTYGDYNGFYAMPLSVFNTITTTNANTMLSYRVAVLPTDSEGTEAERVYITQIVVDEEDGSVYFGYRAPSGGVEKTGLKYYNHTTKVFKTYLEGLEMYGVAINDNKSKLF